MATAEHRPGFPCWVDLMASDVDASMALYADVLGWVSGERSGEEYGGYAMWFRSEVPTAGIGPSRDGSRTSWTSYLATDDIEATLALVGDAGGTVISAAMPVGPLGWMAIVTDPQGAMFGLWQAGDFAGFSRYGEPGFLDWCVTRSTNVEASTSFMKVLFGYEEGIPGPPPPGSGYRELRLHDAPAIGAVETARPAPSDWLPYFMVDDVDAAVGVARTRGGQVLHEAHDTTVGRLAVLVDPEGSAFGIVQQ